MFRTSTCQTAYFTHQLKTNKYEVQRYKLLLGRSGQIFCNVCSYKKSLDARSWDERNNDGLAGGPRGGCNLKETATFVWQPVKNLDQRFAVSVPV
jgi:hypothetical protein